MSDANRTPWTLWNQFWRFLPWSLLPYMWQSILLERENYFRQRLKAKDESYESMCEAYQRDIQNLKREHGESRTADQRSLLLSDLISRLGITLDSDISDVDVCCDGGGDRSSNCSVQFTQDGRRLQYYIVGINVTPLSELAEPG